MQASLPLWLQYAQALSTPSIAILAIVIGIMQWRTAHLRAVVELFERRYAMYQNIRRIISQIVTSGQATNEIHFEFMRAYDGSEFLFGNEVTEYLRKIDFAISDMHIAQLGMTNVNNDERLSAIQERRKQFDVISSFYKEFSKLLLPYVRMHQKAPWL